MVLAALVLITPFPRELIHTVRYSGESMARELSEFLLYAGAALLLSFIVLEWIVRWVIHRRRKEIRQ